MGCDIPKFIEFRTLPVNVQDDRMRADICQQCGLGTRFPVMKGLSTTQWSGEQCFFMQRVMR